MCVVSMVMDGFGDRWKDLTPQWPNPSVLPNTPAPYTPMPTAQPQITKADFDAFRAQIMAELKIMKDMVQRALKYDRDNNEPDCESEEKIAALKTILKTFKIDEGLIDQMLAEKQ